MQKFDPLKSSRLSLVSVWVVSDYNKHKFTWLQKTSGLPLNVLSFLWIFQSLGVSWHFLPPLPPQIQSWRGDTAPPLEGLKGWWWTCLKIKREIVVCNIYVIHVDVHYDDENRSSPIMSLLSKLSSLAWLALRICILMNSIFVLLSCNICWAAASNLRSCGWKKNGEIKWSLSICLNSMVLITFGYLNRIYFNCTPHFIIYWV